MNAHVLQARTPRGERRPVDVSRDPDRTVAFLDDAAHVAGGHADAVAFPRTERDVVELLASASCVLAVGAQSSLTGGATPRGGLVISTSYMRTIEDDGVARVRAGAGVTLTELDAHLLATGRYYPPVPTFQGATVGGVVATNAAGAATFKYGSTRPWVVALTVVLATGEVLDIERGRTFAHTDGFFEIERSGTAVRVPVPAYQMPDTVKLSAGYFARPGMDLIDLFIGSEGTLGVVTAATLRVEPVRPAMCLAFVTVDDPRRALAFVGRLRAIARETWQTRDPMGLDISAVEHLDRRSLALLREDGVDRRLGIELGAQAAVGLLIAIELRAGMNAEEAYDELARSGGADAAGGAGHAPLARFADLLETFGVSDSTIVAMPGDRAGADRLLALREAVPAAVNARVGIAKREVDPRIEKTAADVIVPFDRFGEMLAVFERERHSRRLDLAVWGHISDGNVHPNVIPRCFADVEAGREAMLLFGREAIRLGGAPLAEHGVGRSPIKQRLLAELYGPEGIEQMRRVKRALDPQWKLAPGVIVEA